jgi:hypothetical protein
MPKSELNRFSEWEASLKAELDLLRKQRAELDLELQRVQRKLDLVRQMRALEETPEADISKEPFPITASESKATPTGVREMAKKILSDSQRPLHISEIHRIFLQRGYPIPGGGTPFNILAHMVNDKGFVRVARGTYALAGSVPEEQVMAKAPRRKKARRRARTIQLMKRDS